MLRIAESNCFLVEISVLIFNSDIYDFRKKYGKSKTKTNISIKKKAFIFFIMVEPNNNAPKIKHNNKKMSMISTENQSNVTQ